MISKSGWDCGRDCVVLLRGGCFVCFFNFSVLCLLVFALIVLLEDVRSKLSLGWSSTEGLESVIPVLNVCESLEIDM